MICDKCGKEIVPNVDPRYAIADSDDGKTGRHYACHEQSVDKLHSAIERLPELDRKFKGAMSDLRAALRRKW